MSEAVETYDVVQLPETKRQTLSLQDRFKVIDWLRGRVEPIVAATKTEAAAIVSEACGVTVTASQLWYMIDELPDYGLGARFAIDVLSEPQEIMRRDIDDLRASRDLELTRAKCMADALSDLLHRVASLESREAMR